MYIAFEGSDGTGKTTTMHKVRELLPEAIAEIGIQDCPNIHLTHHPGSTPLGRYLRKLVKSPQTIDPEIEIDPLSRQMLYMVDNVSFGKTILEPALKKGEIVLADRSSRISAIAYGCAEGVSIDEIIKMSVVYNPPLIDRLYVLRCPRDVAKSRMLESRKVEVDHFDQKSDDFFGKVVEVYDNLITGPHDRTVAVSSCVNINNIIYIDTMQSVDGVVSDILDDFKRFALGRIG